MSRVYPGKCLVHYDENNDIKVNSKDILIQEFDSSIYCFAWGYNEYADCLAVGLNSGMVVFEICTALWHLNGSAIIHKLLMLPTMNLSHHWSLFHCHFSFITLSISLGEFNILKVEKNSLKVITNRLSISERSPNKKFSSFSWHPYEHQVFVFLFNSMLDTRSSLWEGRKRTNMRSPYGILSTIFQKSCIALFFLYLFRRPITFRDTVISVDFIEYYHKKKRRNVLSLLVLCEKLIKLIDIEYKSFL